MEYFRITFSTRPHLEKFPDSPPTPYIRYYKGDKKPVSANMNRSFLNAMGTAASGFKIVKTEIHKVSEDKFDLKGKYDELFI